MFIATFRRCDPTTNTANTHTHTYCSIASFLNSNWNFTVVNFITDSNAYSNSYLIISSLFFFLFNILYSPHHVTHTQIQTCTQNFTFSSIENSFGVTMHKSQKMWTILQNFFPLAPVALWIMLFFFFVENKKEWKKMYMNGEKMSTICFRLHCKCTTERTNKIHVEFLLL